MYNIAISYIFFKACNDYITSLVLASNHFALTFVKAMIEFDFRRDAQKY